MHIKEIQLENFKSYLNITFETNHSFNVIIGENNIGKSTIFEAILLWKKCYDRILKSNKIEFYKVDGKESYIPFSEFNFLRLINDTDLFYQAPNKTRVTINICSGTEEFKLTFEISKPQAIPNSYFRFKTIRHSEFLRFSNFLKSKNIKLDKAIFIYQAKPVANILSREPFMNMGQVLKKISIGKSGEVLRNKIIQKDNIKHDLLTTQIKNVLGIKYTFNYRNKNRSVIDEYIDLRVSDGVKELDLHLQGSGFLQIAEIFSTIGYLENAINILLIDEPDSHIHIKLQHRLLEELKKITNTQTFLISHNDNFVSKLNEGELFYISKKNKDSGKLTPLNISDFDIIKKELGGIILALDKLNSTNTICLVEGDDDVEYIEKLIEKYKKIEGSREVVNNITFYHLRGKDFILKKVDFNKRLLLQIFKDKTLTVIFDKDFSTEESRDNLITQLNKKTSSNLSFCHNGYCIESTLFSEPEKLTTLMIKLSNQQPLRIKLFIDEFFSDILIKFKDPTSNLFSTFENKFEGQKKASRPELKDITFNQFIRDTIESDCISYFFNKYLIADFIKSFDTHFNSNIFETNQNNSDNFYSSLLFNKYIDNITDMEDIINNHIELIEKIYEIYNT